MILIVDDSHENRYSLKSLLNRHKFEVDTASSGEEALKKILTSLYSLIILDVQMPEMDGFEVAEALSGYSKSKNIPIIFLSAVNTEKKFITKGYESGAIDYVTKPFDPDILLLKVRTFYKLSEQTRRLLELEKSLREEIELRKNAEKVLEIKVAERTMELNKSNQNLERSNGELQQFAFIASHDLQEPLRKIQTFCNIVLQKHLDEKEKVKFYLEKVYFSASKLRDLVSDLLNYSRVGGEKIFEKVNLRAIIEEVLDDIEIPKSDCNLVLQIPPMPEIEVIPSLIRQVFQNILSNSIKFRRDGVPCNIKIGVEGISEKTLHSPAHAPGNFCRITIGDNGIGFDPDYNNKVFDIFQRLNEHHLYKGSGIGLAVVKRIIELHDGLVAAVGRENEGTTIIIVLPFNHTHR